MAIAAHPDDIESWCAGTLVRALNATTTLRLILVTSGEHGTDKPNAEPAQIAAERERETRNAATHLGISEIQFLHYPDGDVENTRALRRDLVEWVRRWRPEVVFTHDPEHPYPAYLSHRDHREVGRAVLDAIYPLARDRLAFDDSAWISTLEPHQVRSVWLFASAIADSFVDISATFDRKVAARLAHVSQTKDPQALRENWRVRAASIGAPVGLSLAEAFTILSLE